jgi:hypothetical protein
MISGPQYEDGCFSGLLRLSLVEFNRLFRVLAAFIVRVIAVILEAGSTF